MEKRIVAFLDILGFKKLTYENQEETLLKYISPLYFDDVSNVDQKKIYQELGLDKIHTREVTFFSDSIVISCELKEISPLLHHVKRLSEKFVGYELFLRGGITYGELFHKDRIVFGPAMIEAYKMESECAIHPRIIISENLFDELKNNTELPVGRETYEKPKNISEFNEILKPINNIFRDDDGFYFLNPFPLTIELIRQQKLAIENQIAKNRSNKKIYSKYLWLASKFNKYYSNNKKIGAVKI